MISPGRNGSTRAAPAPNGTRRRQTGSLSVLQLLWVLQLLQLLEHGKLLPRLGVGQVSGPCGPLVIILHELVVVRELEALFRFITGQALLFQPTPQHPIASQDPRASPDPATPPSSRPQNRKTTSLLLLPFRRTIAVFPSPAGCPPAARRDAPAPVLFCSPPSPNGSPRRPARTPTPLHQRQRLRREPREGEPAPPFFGLDSPPPSPSVDCPTPRQAELSPMAFSWWG